jgi:hypothetical protein
VKRIGLPKLPQGFALALTLGACGGMLLPASHALATPLKCRLSEKLGEIEIRGKAVARVAGPIEGNIVGSEIGGAASHHEEFKEAYLPHNGNKIATQGDESYVSYTARGRPGEGKLRNAQIVGIRSENGTLRLSVIDAADEGHGSIPHELTLEEVESTVANPAAKRHFASVHVDMSAAETPQLTAPEQEVVIENLRSAEEETFANALSYQPIKDDLGYKHREVQLIIDPDGKVVHYGGLKTVAPGAQRDFAQRLADGTYKKSVLRVKLLADGDGTAYDIDYGTANEPAQRRALQVFKDELNARYEARESVRKAAASHMNLPEYRRISPTEAKAWANDQIKDARKSADFLKHTDPEAAKKWRDYADDLERKLRCM